LQLQLLVIRPPGTVVPGGLTFYCGFFWHFAALYLRAASAERRETFTHDYKCGHLDNVGSGVTTRRSEAIASGRQAAGALGGAFGRRIVCFALRNSAEFLKRAKS